MQIVPAWLKLAYAAWMVVWIPVYWVHNGPANFLWFCDLANFILGLGLWFESSLLVSSQAVGVLVVQILWICDVLGRLLLGRHLIGGTEYMFDPAEPFGVRLLSLFHVVMPGLLLWGIARLGFDRRGLRLQTAINWVVLPICFFFTDPVRNLNWLHEPFGLEQTLMPPLVFLFVSMVAGPLVLYVPSHFGLLALARRRAWRVLP